MKYSTLLAAGCLTLGLAFTVGAGDAQAQFPYSGTGAAPQNRPAFSPYLNLLRRGNSPAFNYFSLVRPQLEFQNSLYGVQQQSALNTQSIDNLQSSNLPTTGHPAMFLNLGGYFQSGGAGASVNRPGGGQGTAGFSSGSSGGYQRPPSRGLTGR